MKIIEWDESLSIGVEIIDEQHKSLVKITNDLINTFQEIKRESTVETILLGLIDYSIYHFDAEELYAEEFGSKTLEVHKKEHQEFINKVSEFQKNMKSKGEKINLEILAYLKNWLITHIKKDDKKLFSEQS